VPGARREERLADLTSAIDEAGGQAEYRVTDVTKRADLDSLVAHATRRFGWLDAIVNNAGVGPISRFDALRVEDWDEMIDVNLRGALYGIAAALPIFARQRRGHVINVISTAGIKIVPTMGVYAAPKNAVRTATEALRQEAGPCLRVTEISPGVIATDFSRSITDRAAREAVEKRIVVLRGGDLLAIRSLASSGEAARSNAEKVLKAVTPRLIAK